MQLIAGQNSYIADFEVYNQQSQNSEQVLLDIYIGIKKIGVWIEETNMDSLLKALSKFDRFR